MRNAVTVHREAAEDIFFGQTVIHWARWFVIAAGTAIVLLVADSTNDLILGITPIIGMIAMNFYVHGRRLAEKPANAGMVVASAVLDVALITAAVAIGVGTGTQGLASQFYVAYVPVILAFAFVMPTSATVVFTLATVGAYALVCILGSSEAAGPFESSMNVESMVTRMVVMAATGGIGSYFWRLQRNRRRELATAGT